MKTLIVCGKISGTDVATGLVIFLIVAVIIISFIIIENYRIKRARRIMSRDPYSETARRLGEDHP